MPWDSLLILLDFLAFIEILQYMKFPFPLYTPSTRPAMCILSNTNQKSFYPLQLEGVTSVVSCVKMSTNSCYEIG